MWPSDDSFEWRDGASCSGDIQEGPIYNLGLVTSRPVSPGSLVLVILLLVLSLPTHHS
jgi:hypothetical protein